MISLNPTSEVDGSKPTPPKSNIQELEGRYSNRVRSRMRQLFNLIAFDQKSIDKRK